MADLLVDVTSLDTDWDCGYGFWTSNSDHTIVVLVGTDDPPGLATPEIPVSSSLEDPMWEVEVLTGRDLMAGWCSDIVTDVDSVVEHRWDTSGGTIEVANPPSEDGGAVTAYISGLTASLPDGPELEFPDLEVTNPCWGCFAG